MKSKQLILNANTEEELRESIDTIIDEVKDHLTSEKFTKEINNDDTLLDEEKQLALSKQAIFRNPFLMK